MMMYQRHLPHPMCLKKHPLLRQRRRRRLLQGNYHRRHDYLLRRQHYPDQTFQHRQRRLFRFPQHRHRHLNRHLNQQFH
jgi:hypothetical protein